MEKVVLNPHNLDDDIFAKYKARALIFNEFGKILVGNYNGVYMLPGGKVDAGESFDSAIIRELKEETGHDFSFYDIYPFLEVNFYLKDYPDRNFGVINKKVITRYYESEVYVNGIISDRNLSASEIENNYFLDFYSLDELIELLESNSTDNPRNKYFTEELLIVLQHIDVPKKSYCKVRTR